MLLESGFVATSGRDYRRWQVGGRWFHHILDPRTGQPAQTDVYTATTISRSYLISELSAKAALILGMDEGLQWIERHPRVEALLVRETGEVKMSSGMVNYLVEEITADE